ncbi:MAG: phosphotransferase [Candidatus Izimaplasma sp.]|nr:phosphotransferase [Candidatus Izimaplasma bacterium]
MTQHHVFLKKLGLTDITSLNGFHNQIFSGKHNDTKIIVRVTPINQRRSNTELEAELKFLDICDQANISVGMPYAINEKTIIQHNKFFYIFFKFIEGKLWHQCEHNEKTYFNAGKNLALIHKVSMKLPNKLERKGYTKHPDIKLVRQLDNRYQVALSSTLEKIDSWSKTTQEVGLIHGDYLFSNMIYHKDDTLTVIDFDDIEYGYYLYDIAVYLFYYLLGGNPLQIDYAPNKRIFKSFINGYLSVNKTVDLDFSKIQTLFLLRQIKLLATIKSSIKEKDMGDWQKANIKKTDQDLKNNHEFVNIDYDKMYKELRK